MGLLRVVRSAPYSISRIHKIELAGRLGAETTMTLALDRGATAHGELEPCVKPVEKDRKCKK
jgi:hypothetical protein